MRPFKLGLSRPKSKKKGDSESVDNSESTTDISQMDEINVSRETIEDITDSLLKRVIKPEPESISDKSIQSDEGYVVQCKVENESIVDLVKKVSKSHEPLQPVIAEAYDLEKQFEPKPGTSNIKIDKSFNQTFNNSDNEIESSSENDSLGIMSFYDKSKIFDMSVEDKVDSESQESIKAVNYENMFIEKRESIEVKHSEIQMETGKTLKELNVKTEHNNITLFQKKDLKILTPKIKPPTEGYVCSSLQQYKIPKVRNFEPYYSDHKDVGDKVEIGNMVLKVNSKLSRDQKPFDKVLGITSIEEWRHLLFLQTNEMSQESTKPDALKILLAGNRKCILEPVKKPPTKNEIKKWLLNKDREVTLEDRTANDENITTDIDELDNSQALGLKYEIDSSISMEVDEKVRNSNC